jgi:hypothetical protein
MPEIIRQLDFLEARKCQGLSAKNQATAVLQEKLDRITSRPPYRNCLSDLKLNAADQLPTL